VIIGTKTFSMDSGGGYYEFMKYLENNGRQYHLEITKRLNDMKSIERLVLTMQRVDDIA